MSMNKKQKDDMLKVFAEGFHGVVVPELEKIDGKLDTGGEDLKEVKMAVDSLDRKFDAQQTRLDRHGKDIEFLKSHFTAVS